MTTVTDEEVRDSVLEIQRSRKLRMIVVLFGFLVVAAVGAGAVLLAYDDAPDAATTPSAGAEE